MTEAQVLHEIELIVKAIAPNFIFGYFTLEDIKQTAWLFAIEGMEFYDESRPLSNFLFCHVRNRLINYRRDHYFRSEPACQLCFHKEAGQTDHDDGQFCKKHKAWLKRNANKQTLMGAARLSTKSEVDLTFLPAQNNNEELSQIIDDKLPVSLREPYLKMLHGANVPSHLKKKVIQAIREILCPYIEQEN
jgi:DNA-directed RNA polymerase specialized sigma24 family protein